SAQASLHSEARAGNGLNVIATRAPRTSLVLVISLLLFGGGGPSLLFGRPNVGRPEKERKGEDGNFLFLLLRLGSRRDPPVVCDALRHDGKREVLLELRLKIC